MLTRRNSGQPEVVEARQIDGDVGRLPKKKTKARGRCRALQLERVVAVEAAECGGALGIVSTG